MKFTDDDLKQLIKDYDGCQYFIASVALLARLEAAEVFADMAALAHPALKYDCNYEAWRKAAGK